MKAVLLMDKSLQSAEITELLHTDKVPNHVDLAAALFMLDVTAAVGTTLDIEVSAELPYMTVPIGSFTQVTGVSKSILVIDTCVEYVSIKVTPVGGSFDFKLAVVRH